MNEEMQPVQFDPLANVSDTASHNNNGRANGPQAAAHMQTYTAGEDSSRLAAAAKELGLQQARQPRKQVRARQPRLLHNPADVLELLLETTTEDARMRAIYTSRGELPIDGAPVLEPHAEGMGGDLISAVLGIIKGMVGPAILYVPAGFAKAGFAIAIPIMMSTTALFLYSSNCLLESWKLENEKAENSSLLGGNRRIMLSYPVLAYRALGDTGESLVKMGIALMQSGVCLTYLIFVPQNLHTSMLQIFGWDVSPSIWLILMIAIQIPLSWVHDIRKLTPTNLAANCLILYGLTVCLYFAVSESFKGDKSGPIANLWDHFTDLSPFANGWFLFIGTSVRVRNYFELLVD